MTLKASVFDGRDILPVALRIWPKYWIYLVKKWYLLSFMDILHSGVCERLVGDGPDGLLWSYCR